MNSKLLGQSNS